MIRIPEGLIDLIFPPNCLVCRRRDSHAREFLLCRICAENITPVQPPLCPACGRPGVYSGCLCRECRDRPPAYDFVWSACLYDDFLKYLVLKFKYHRKTGLRRLFAQRILTHIEDHQLDIAQFDALIPVPLFPSRLRLRGYNQSLLLAEEIGRSHRISVEKNALLRIKPTPSQTLLSQKDRWTNISGAFRIAPFFNPERLKLLLVDDLLTTGATASQAAEILKSAGAVRVGVLTLATVG